jgi:23S rRNA (pseudouridine1915-N3)-methyltransferase
VGRTKDRNLAENIEYYRRLLSRDSHFSILEIKDERGKSAAVIREIEGERILAASQSFILLDEQGRQLTSTEFSKYISSLQTADFVIGGAFGVSDDVRQRAKDSIALSRMTLTHEMARLVFMEQLFRAHSILKGKGYHH